MSENTQVIHRERADVSIAGWRAHAIARDLLPAALAQAPAVVWAVDLEGRMLLTQGKALEVWGLEPGDALGRPIEDVFTDVPEVGRGIRRALDGQTVHTALEIDDLSWDAWLGPLHSARGEIVGAVGVAVDATHRRRAELEWKREHRLLREALNAHERDRQLVAYEIHDGMVQQAVAARMHLEGLLGNGRDLPSAAREEIRLAASRLDRAIVEARRLIGGLRPPVLDEHGLLAALEHMIDQQPDGGPVVLLDARIGSARYDPLVEGAVFRIVQEALTNARRHSASDRVEIVLHQKRARIRIEIRDWGTGFDPASVESSRFGLQGMRERARLLQGRIDIESSPGAGTRVIVELPVLSARS